MREWFPLIFSAIAILVVGGIQILLLAFLNRPWWKKRWVRRSSWMLPLLGILMISIWALGEYNHLKWLSFPAAILGVLVFVLEVALMISLPPAGFMHFVNWLIDRFRKPSDKDKCEKIDSHRRALLRSAAIVLPAVTVGMSVAGVTHALGDVEINETPMFIDNLPHSLEGFKILHLSDVHLGHYLNLEDFEEIIHQAHLKKPNLVVMTGDTADILDMLPGAIDLVEQLKPQYGAYAVMGNHEYFRGPTQAIKVFGQSTTPLLINQAVTLDVEGASLTVAGIDDPRTMHGEQDNFFEHVIDQTLSGTPDDSFKLLLSHRPPAFDYAASVGVDLVLSGHTHGGQIGLAGRSVFERFFGGRYLWGHYSIGKSQMFTSAGAGHWFPFRLGCPAEAPLIVLQSSQNMS